MAFDEVLGHERVRELLSRALDAARLPPALLLSGPDGVGKRTLALAVGRALVCERRGGCEPTCAPCRRAAQGAHPDVILVRPETQAIKIAQIRGVVREIMGRPFEARARAVVIDDAHSMTEEAANALLKSLEEPPATSHVLLVTSAPQALLPTIRSRCQTLRMGPLPPALLERHLRSQLGLEAEEARLRAALAGGSVGAALAFESEAYRAVREQLLALLEAPSGALARAEAAERIADLDDPLAALTVLRSLLRDVEAIRCGGAADRLLNRDVAGRLAPLAEGPLGARALSLMGLAGETTERLQANANKLLAMDLLVEAVSAE
jgi:DNA polymerase III subunit delta'